MIQGFMVGRIGKDADLRSIKTKNGETSLSKFSLAVKTGHGESERVIWVDCVLWGKMAESLTQYLRKGTQIAALGELDVRAWTSEKDQEVRASMQLSISELTLCGSKTVAA